MTESLTDPRAYHGLYMINSQSLFKVNKKDSINESSH